MVDEEIRFSEIVEGFGDDIGIKVRVRMYSCGEYGDESRERLIGVKRTYEQRNEDR